MMQVLLAFGLKIKNILLPHFAKIKKLSRMSAQAVGGAVGHNPISIIIPCHRVVGTNGNLTGYAGGIDRKVKLLETEHVDVGSFFVPEENSGGLQVTCLASSEYLAQVPNKVPNKVPGSCRADISCNLQKSANFKQRFAGNFKPFCAYCG